MGKEARAVAIIFICVAGCRLVTEERLPQQNSYEAFADHYACLAKYKLGSTLIQELSALDSEGRKNLDIAAYRQEKVAFFGVGAPPGGSNDLITESGCYLRVISKEGKDFRPTAAWWEVLVIGEIQQVLPENKIIVIEVKEGDWILVQTG